MIPRRLLTVMLLLLVGLVIASAVAPPPEDEGEETARTSTSQATTTTPTTPAEPDPEPAEDAPDADADGVAGVLPRDKTVNARPGEAIELQVTAKEAATIEIPALGAMQPAAPQAPAQFVVAVDETGRYDVRDLAADRSLGTVVVAE